jgi:NADH:ubiquinone oxidoreductase subunit H
MRLRGGHLFLFLIACILAVNVWLLRTTFVPILHGARVEYILVGALALVAVHTLSWRYLLRRGGPVGFALRDVLYFAP